MVESVRNDDSYSIHTSNRTEADLFTYKAYIERIVDGDTMIMELCSQFFVLCF